MEAVWGDPAALAIAPDRAGEGDRPRGAGGDATGETAADELGEGLDTEDGGLVGAVLAAGASAGDRDARGVPEEPDEEHEPDDEEPAEARAVAAGDAEGGDDLPPGTRRERPFFGRAAELDERGRQPRLKQRPQDFRVREVVDLPPEVTSPPEAGGAERSFFLHLLSKKKLTTPEAIGLIAKRFSIPRSDFSYAGLKDKQSVSEQVISIRGRAVEMREPGLKVRPIGRRATPISSADVKANRFDITVRGLTQDDLRDLDRRIEEVAEQGFPSYFDSQRFGSARFGQGFFGRALVRGDPEGALRLFMATPSPRDHSRDRFVKQVIAERWGDWEGLSRRMRASPYGRILGHLAHRPGDFMGAIGYMSRPLRALHLFAYQSLIWNNSAIFFLRHLVPKEARFTVPYQVGRLVFVKRVDSALAERLRRVEVPLVGPETRVEDPDVRTAVERALETEGVRLENLALPEEAGGFFRDEPRPLLVFPHGARASAPESDELNAGRAKVLLSFELPRGAYGTLFVKRLFRG